MTTGQAAWWAHCWLTEPSSSPAKPPWPREPTTSRSASRDSSTRTAAGAAFDHTPLDLDRVRFADRPPQRLLQRGLGGVAELLDVAARQPGRRPRGRSLRCSRTARRGRRVVSPDGASPPRVRNAVPPSRPPSGQRRRRSQPSRLLLLSSFVDRGRLGSPLLRVDVLECVRRRRIGSRLGELDRRVGDLLRLGVEVVPFLVAQLEPLTQVLDRIASLRAAASALPCRDRPARHRCSGRSAARSRRAGRRDL